MQGSPGITARERALERWENEGGATAARAGWRAESSGRPTLPPGHTTQAGWGFFDDKEDVSYDFHRVYDASDNLVPELCYWAVTWNSATGTTAAHSSGKWVSWAQARKRRGRLGFERFSSLYHMRETHPRLL